MIDQGLIDRAGGPAAICDIYGYACSTGLFRGYLKEVCNKYVIRRQIQVCNDGIANAYGSPGEAMETLDALEREVMAIRDACEATATEQTLKESVQKFLDEFRACMDGKGSLPGLTTGFEEFDRMTGGGMKPADMVVLAARPSMGKTALMMNIVEHVVFELEKAALVFSVEMSQNQLVSRLIASRAKFAMSQLSRGYPPNHGDLQRIQRAAYDTASAKDRLIVDQRPDITINQIRARGRRAKRDFGIEFIAIDYLQLIKSKSKQADGSREREIAEISSGIKALAKELGIPILILAQLNRGPETRTGKKHGVPRMSDLRESGAIEQDADVVGLLYRDAYYAEDEKSKDAAAGYAQLNIAKNRNGETGTIHLTFIAELMCFESGVAVRENAYENKPKSRYGD